MANPQGVWGRVSIPSSSTAMQAKLVPVAETSLPWQAGAALAWLRLHGFVRRGRGGASSPLTLPISFDGMGYSAVARC